MAKIVPLGIDFFGSFKSPDIETPASKPVTAGKNTANSTIQGTALDAVSISGSAGLNSCLPKKIETSESTITARITN